MKKKILHWLLAVIMVAQLLPMSLASAEKVYDIAEGTSYADKKGTTTNDRISSVATKKIGEKEYAYLIEDNNLFVVDTAKTTENIIQTVTFEKDQVGDYYADRVAVYGDYLLAAYQVDNKVYAFKIGTDGKINTTAEKEISLGNASRILVVDNYLFLEGKNSCDIYDSSFTKLATAPRGGTFGDDTYTADALCSLDVIKKSDGKYRLAYIDRCKLSGSANPKLRIEDFDPSTKTFTNVYFGDPNGSSTDENAVKTSAGTSVRIALMTETMLAMGQDRKYISVVDFSNASAVSVTDTAATFRTQTLKRVDDTKFLAGGADGLVALYEITSSGVAQIDKHDAVGGNVYDMELMSSGKLAAACSNKFAVYNFTTPDVDTPVVPDEPETPAPEEPTEPEVIITVNEEVSDENKAGSLAHGIASKLGGSVDVYEATDGKKYAYLSTTGGLVVYNITTPSAMSIVESHTNITFPERQDLLLVKNGYLFVNAKIDSDSNYKVYALPITDADGKIDLANKKVIVNTAVLTEIEVIDNYMFASANGTNRNFYIYDISNPANTTEIGKYAPADANGKNGWYKPETEKISDGLYRTYAIARTDMTTGGYTKGYHFAILDTAIANGEATVTSRYYGDIANTYGATDTSDYQRVMDIEILDGGKEIALAYDVNTNGIGGYLEKINVTDPTAPALTVQTSTERLNAVKAITNEYYLVSTTAGGISLYKKGASADTKLADLAPSVGQVYQMVLDNGSLLAPGREGLAIYENVYTETPVSGGEENPTDPEEPTQPEYTVTYKLANGTGYADVQTTNDRISSVATKKIGDKEYAYLIEDNNLFVVDTAKTTENIIQTVTFEKDQVGDYYADRVAVYGDYLLAAYQTDNKVYAFKIGTDGKINTTAEKEISLGNASRILVVDDYLFLEGKQLCEIYDSNFTKVETAPRGGTFEENTYAADAFCSLDVIKKSDGKYRLAYIDRCKLSGSADPKLRIEDFDPSTKTFTNVYFGDPNGSSTDENAVKTSAGTSVRIALMTETMLAMGQDKKYISAVDFSNTADIKVTNTSAIFRTQTLKRVDDTKFLAGGADGLVALYEITSSGVAQIDKHDAVGGNVYDMELMSSGKLAVACSNKFAVYDFATYTPVLKAEITDVKYESNALTFTFKNLAYTGTATVYVAVYEDGRLADVDVIAVTATAGNAQNMTPDVKLENGQTLKIFTWNRSLQPVIDPVKGTYNGTSLNF